LLDSKERFNAPKCAENTRVLTIEKLENWIDSDNPNASMAWLHGAVGAGKTALAQTLAELYKRRKRLAGNLFFSRTSTSSQSNDGDRLIPTLVFQLLQAFDGIGQDIEKEILKYPNIFTDSRSVQMRHLFIDPLIARRRHLPQRIRRLLGKVIAAKDETKRGWLVVIDGLDECEDPNIQEDLLRILAEAIPKLPFRFRFLVTSRAEAHILRTFDHHPAFAGIQVQRINLGENPDAVEDIQRVLELEFQTIRRTHPLAKYLDSNWPSPKDVKTLTSRASTQFIYVATVIKYIRSPKHRPDERLKIIIELSTPPASDKPYAPLDSLYSHVLSGVAEEHLADVILIFSILHHLGLRKETLSRRFPNTLRGLEDLLMKKEGDLRIQLDPLRSLIAIPDDDFVRIKVYHASFFDYLLDEGRSGPFHIRHGSAEEALTLHDITMMSDYLSNPDCGCEILYYFTHK